MLQIPNDALRVSRVANVLLLRVNDVRWIGRQASRLGKRITKFYGTIVNVIYIFAICVKRIEFIILCVYVCVPCNKKNSFSNPI